MPRPRPHGRDRRRPFAIRPAARRAGPWMRRLAAAALLLAPGLALPASVHAHARLTASSPAPGATVPAPLHEIRLEFSEAVEPRYTSLVLLAPSGAAVPTGPLAPAPGSRREFVATLGPLAEDGTYTVRWRTAGADGHIIQGSFSFVVEGTAAAAPAPAHSPAAPPATTPLPPEHHPPAAEIPTAFQPTAPLPVAVRWLHFLVLLGLVGAVTFRLAIVPRLHHDPRTAALAAASAAGAWRIALAALGALALVAVARLWVQSTALHGPAHAWSAEHLGTMLRLTIWGRAWLLQMAMAALLLSGLLVARPGLHHSGRPAGWTMAAVAVLGLCVVPGLSGHAAAVPRAPALAVANDALHVLGGGAWLGTLAVLLLVALPAALRTPDTDRLHAAAVIITLFSPLALAAAALVGLTGIVNSLLHLGAPAQLWTTGYGRALLLKLGILATVAALGFYNWRVVRPALGAAAATRRLRRAAGTELAVGALVLLVTAVLVALPTP